MVGMNVKLMDPQETRKMFGHDEVFQNIIKTSGIDPQALEITYGGAGSAGFTELGTAATAEFIGAAMEKTTILATTRVLTPGGSYFLFYVIAATGVITTYYAWFSKYEVFTVKCLAAASITTGTYFEIVDSQAVPTSYYVWMDKNGNGVTDDPGHATYTGVPCNISAATTADSVATIVTAAITALAGFGATAATDTVTATCATKGDPTDAVDVDTTFTITVTENGGADPGITGTGAECDIKAATTAANVGTIIAAVINALTDVAATGTTTVTVINGNVGAVTAITDVGTGFTITQVEAGRDNNSGAPIYLVSAQANDTDLITGDMRKAMALGITKDTIPKLQTEEISLSGATRVKSSEILWERIIHVAGSDWGSGGSDALGNISMQDVGGVVSYLVITAATNESEGGVIWVPNGWHAMIAEMSLDLHDIAIAAITDGAVVRFEKYGFDDTKNNRVYNLDPDNNYIAISATLGSPHTNIKWPEKSQLHGTNVAKLTIKEALVTTTVDFIFKAYVLMWYHENTPQVLT